MTLRIARLPDDKEIVAIGDVHGRADLLEAMVEYFEFGAEMDFTERCVFVFLGDLIDRGPESGRAIELALAACERNPGSVIILGNHEEFMLDFVHGNDWWNAWDAWKYEGGLETLKSLDIEERRDPKILRMEVGRHETVRRLAAVAVDAACDAKRIFAHAGIRPHIDLEKQMSFDLRWIRDEFLESRADHGRTVVHGHSITESGLPEVHRNRIAIDTGSFITGRLTAAWFKPDGTSGFTAAEGASRGEEPVPIYTGPIEPITDGPRS